MVCMSRWQGFDFWLCCADFVCSQAAQLLPADGDGSFTSSSTDMVDGTAQLLQQGLSTAGQHDEQRWVPYRHTNGVAIYHHKESAAAGCSLWSCGQVKCKGQLHDNHLVTIGSPVTQLTSS